jgi:L-lactate permease
MKSVQKLYIVMFALLVSAFTLHIAGQFVGPALPSLVLVVITLAIVMRLLRR